MGKCIGPGMDEIKEPDKVEIRLIDPPEDIKTAMHKQKTAERSGGAPCGCWQPANSRLPSSKKLAIIQRAEGRRTRSAHSSGPSHPPGLMKPAEKYFIGNAQYLKQMEMIENSLRENAKIVITEHGISPTLLPGSLPVERNQ